MSAPSQLPTWNTGGANRVDPSAGKKILGWVVAEPVDSSFFNWWMWTVYQWCLYLQGITSEALTWTVGQLFNDGITVVRATTGNAVTGTAGSGAANAGVKGIGAAGTASTGVYGLSTTSATGIGVVGSGKAYGVSGDADFTGGVGTYGRGFAFGVDGIGSGTTNGTGVRGTGGPTNGTGVEGNGSGSGYGVKGTAAPGGSGTGGYFTGGLVNGSGVEGYGTGSGYGGYFYANGAADGVRGTSIGGIGFAAINGVGASSGTVGGKFQGGASANGLISTGGASGYGAVAVGGSGTAGLRAERSDALTSQPAIECRGTIDLQGSSAPAGTTATQNKLNRMSFSKAGACVTLNNTISPGVTSSTNIASVAQNLGTGIITVTFAQAMATTDYRINLFREFWPTAAHGYLPSVSSKTVGGFTMTFLDNTGAGLGAGAGSTVRFTFDVFGDQ